MRLMWYNCLILLSQKDRSSSNAWFICLETILRLMVLSLSNFSAISVLNLGNLAQNSSNDGTSSLFFFLIDSTNSLPSVEFSLEVSSIFRLQISNRFNLFNHFNLISSIKVRLMSSATFLFENYGGWKWSRNLSKTLIYPNCDTMQSCC